MPQPVRLREPAARARRAARALMPPVVVAVFLREGSPVWRRP